MILTIHRSSECDVGSFLYAHTHPDTINATTATVIRMAAATLDFSWFVAGSSENEDSLFDTCSQPQAGP